jgi:hypothetical protein
MTQLRGVEFLHWVRGGGITPPQFLHPMFVLVVAVVLVVVLNLGLTLALSLSLRVVTTPSFLHFVIIPMNKGRNKGNGKNKSKNPCVYRLPLNG